MPSQAIKAMECSTGEKRRCVVEDREGGGSEERDEDVDVYQVVSRVCV